MTSLVNLTCIAYKSNLITNESLMDIYNCMLNDCRLNGLLAFYCRFLASYGYADSIRFLEDLHSKWIKLLNDYRLVRTFLVRVYITFFFLIACFILLLLKQKIET